MRRIDHAQILQAAGGFDVRQQAVKKLAFPFAVEDNHRHPARAKAPRHILGDDVFKERGLARARAAHDDAVLHPHRIRPQPWLLVDVVSEQRSSALAGIADHLGVPGCRDHDGGVRPVFFSLLPAANQLRHNEAAAEEQDGAVEEDFQALRIAQMEARHSDVPAESNGGAGE